MFSQNATRHKNHRQVANNDPNNNQADRGHRRESSRSYNFKKRSRSEIAFDEGGTSMSERYSNSIASSRESSTSLSVKSGKRRISITSYSESKKIPWWVNGKKIVEKNFIQTKNFFLVFCNRCGCWGNSCIWSWSESVIIIRCWKRRFLENKKKKRTISILGFWNKNDF